MREYLTAFATDDDGATAIEYGLIAALVAVAIIPALLTFSDKFKTMYDLITTTLGG